LPESSAPESRALREEILRLLEHRFGVSGEALTDLAFSERGEEIWACSSLPPRGIESGRPSGLRAFRRQPDGLKPTSVFLIALGDRILSSRLELASNDLRDVLLGQRIPIPSDHTDGYVALCFRADVIGCGRIRSGLLQGLIPTGRRREFLGALAADPRS
jgi:NOL1/NOP2/fmu family ribosome biogenesis protein